MSVYRPKYTDKETGEVKQSRIWWYDFRLAGKRIIESSKTHLKTLAKEAEQNRLRELQEGFNGIKDNRSERIRTIKELAEAYLEDYKLRHRSATFAEYALNHVSRLVGPLHSWNNVKAKAKVTGRWQDNRHTLITDLAESGAGDETIRDIAGHVSKQMLKHYSHIRMEAKRTALESIVAKKADPKPAEEKRAVPTEISRLEDGEATNVATASVN